MGRFHLGLLITLLLVVGLGLFAYKAFVLDFPTAPNVESPIWNLEARVSFTGKGKPTKVQLAIPSTSPDALLMDESFVSAGFGLNTKADDGARTAVWSIRKAVGRQTLYYRAIVYAVEQKSLEQQVRKAPEVEEPEFEGAQHAAATELVQQITGKSADTEGFVAELLRVFSQESNQQELRTLLKKRTSDAERVELLVALLAYAQIPARSVHGIRLTEQGGRVPLLHWIEVYEREHKHWQAYELRGKKGIPSDYFAWWRGPLPLVSGTAAKPEVTLSSSRSQEAALLPALRGEQVTNPLLFEFSLFKLPITTQVVYRILFMIPLGAFIIVLLRNIIGFQTFGTFMPVLIALAFRETQLSWGIILFVLLVSLGLFVRFYFEKLKLLLVPRLTAGLIVVVLLMAVLSIVTHKFGIESGLSVALFPMVIIAMTIERMSIVWEEQGATDAIKQGIGSLGAASLCYLVMSSDYLQHLVFVFPELLLVLLAATILLGRYTGYRLVELRRFRELSQLSDPRGGSHV